MARGFCFVQILEVNDPDRYAQYRREVAGLLEPYGGRVIVGRASRRQTVEGGWDPEAFMVIEFPSYEAAQGWYFSEGYQKALAGRMEACVTMALIAEEQ